VTFTKPNIDVVIDILNINWLCNSFSSSKSLISSAPSSSIRVVESLKHNLFHLERITNIDGLQADMWRRWTAYLCILFINIAAVVSEKKCRTRFTCIRPTRDNVSSILFDKFHDDGDVSYNHGKKYCLSPCLLYCVVSCVRYIALKSDIYVLPVFPISILHLNFVNTSYALFSLHHTSYQFANCLNTSYASLIHTEEVGITQPTSDNDDDGIFPLCIGYSKEIKRRNHKQIIKEKNNDDTRTVCSSTTVDGWRVLRFYKRVGHGNQCYKRVQEAVFDWDFASYVGKKSMGIISATDCTRSTNKTRKGLLATFTEIYIPRPFKSVFAVNPVHVVYDVKNHQRSTVKGKCISSSTAYATMSGHLLSGEERVSVVWNRSNDEVYVEIVSFSRAAPSVTGRLIWPLIGGLQKNFFLSELDHLDKVEKTLT